MASSNLDQGQYYLECDVCQYPAAFTCRRCTVKLCTICVGPHMLLQSENDHDVVKYSELNKTEGGKCSAHPLQQCSGFCKTCEIPVCILCVSIKHKTHEILNLAEKANELLDFILKKNERLQAMRSHLETFLDHTRKRIEALPRFYQQSKDEITNRAKEGQQEIRKIEKTVHEDLDKIQEKNLILILKQENEFQDILEKFKSLKQSVFSLSKFKDVSGLMALRLEIENLQVPSSVEETPPAFFQPCKMDKNYIANNFGYIETLESFKISIDDIKVEDPVQPPRRALDVPTVLFTFDTEFPAHKNGGRLYSIVSLGNDRVWTGGHSKDLKLYDLQGRLLDTVTISARGHYLTLHKGNIVYSDPENNTVRIINNREVNTLFHTGEWRPQGIACTAAGNLLVCLRTPDGKESKVVRYSTSGDVLQEIQYDSEYQPLFQRPDRLVENGNGDICVADLGKWALIVLDKYGIFRFSYTRNEESDGSFGAPLSLTTDNMHHIIITDFPNSKIHMLDRDGRFLRYIIPDLAIEKPLPMCVIKEGELMIGENKTGKVKRIKYLQ